jgi:chemotaxis methyl-accepting protein methylase
MTDETFILLRDFIYEQSGIIFTDGKKEQLASRLALRLKANNLKDFDKYSTCSSTIPAHPRS